MECSICLREEIEEPVVTRCGHVFCWPCLFRWAWAPISSDPPLRTRSSCPACKSYLPDPNFSVTPIYCATHSSSLSPSSSQGSDRDRSSAEAEAAAAAAAEQISDDDDDHNALRNKLRIPPRPKPYLPFMPNPNNPSVPNLNANHYIARNLYPNYSIEHNPNPNYTYNYIIALLVERLRLIVSRTDPLPSSIFSAPPPLPTDIMHRRDTGFLQPRGPLIIPPQNLSATYSVHDFTSYPQRAINRHAIYNYFSQACNSSTLNHHHHRHQH